MVQLNPPKQANITTTTRSTAGTWPMPSRRTACTTGLNKKASWMARATGISTALAQYSEAVIRVRLASTYNRGNLRLTDSRGSSPRGIALSFRRWVCIHHHSCVGVLQEDQHTIADQAHGCGRFHGALHPCGSACIIALIRGL